MLGCMVCCLAFAQTTVLPYGSVWKYLDNGTDQGTAWRSPAFNDGGWASGAAQLGYGDGDEATVVSFGPNSASRYITTYFRASFTIADVSTIVQLNGILRRDDGAIVYVNGQEVFRSNLAAGAVSYTTLATLANDDGNTDQPFTIPAAALVNGNNSVAVEIHQNAASSSDISFDMNLQAVQAAIPDAGLIDYGTAWKYLDNGSNQGTAWRSGAFNDGAWKSGSAPLGYGITGVNTTVSFGTKAAKKYITTYFRKAFSASNPGQYASLELSIKRDDGAVVYLNGTEVYRTNLPTGSISYTTKATNATDNGSVAQVVSLPTSAIVSGNNVIAVEVHQTSASSTDLYLDLQLKAKAPAAAATLTRGPYLQMVNGTGVTVRWRTDVPTNSTIRLGTAHGTYPLESSDAIQTTEHEIRINGLQPGTRYYYSFGSSSQTLQSGTDNFVWTQAPAASAQKTRVAVFGDCGRNDNNYQSQTLQAYRNYVGNNPAELLLLLGDNAYTNGTDAEYQTQFFNAYQGSILKNHALFPAPGNHDYYSSAQNLRTGAYYQNFTMPTQGECGGQASQTEAWYSYNWGNIHFISLDSYGRENNNTTRLYDTLGAQVNWLKTDLAANAAKWTVVYWHHPPYTMGSHNSDTESELVNMRQNFIRILERYGVDLILCGHSHDYERSYLLKDYYSNEASFNLATHAISASSGKYNSSANSCTYTLPEGRINHGAVYVVSGSSGASGGVQAGYPHNALPWSINDGGMFYFEVEDNRLDAKFIRRTGEIWDQFTIMKAVNRSAETTITQGESATLTASWPGNYAWSTGATLRSVTVTPAATSQYTVSDAQGCLQDAFTVNVVPPTAPAGRKKGNKLQVYPSPAFVGSILSFSTTTASSISIYNSAGKLMTRFACNGNCQVPASILGKGWFRATANYGSNSSSKSFVIQ